MEEQEKDRKKFSDHYDSKEWSSGSSLKILTNKQMINVCLYYLLKYKQEIILNHLKMK